jgi:DNA-binding response OmpR family regulator
MENISSSSQSILENNNNNNIDSSDEAQMMSMKNDNDDDDDKRVNRILLVDDEPDITLSFSIVLEDNGFVVDTFNNPISALSSFKQGLYALALIDFRMPDMNGFELYNEIRKIDDRVKVCFITAFDIQQDDLKAAIPQLNVEKNIIIKKPIEIGDLAKVVTAQIEKV